MPFSQAFEKKGQLKIKMHYVLPLNYKQMWEKLQFVKSKSVFSVFNKSFAPFTLWYFKISQYATAKY